MSNVCAQIAQSLRLDLNDMPGQTALAMVRWAYCVSLLSAMAMVLLSMTFVLPPHLAQFIAIVCSNLGLSQVL